MVGIKGSLQLRQAQNLALTPQLQQAIKLLQLSTLELKQEIQQALDLNPLLELANENNNTEISLDDWQEDQIDDNDDYDVFDNDASVNSSDISMSKEVELNEDANVKYDLSDVLNDNANISNNVDTSESYSTDSNYIKAGSKGLVLDSDDHIYEGQTYESLHDHLIEQLELSPLQGADKAIAYAIIDCIDEKGYLKESTENIAQTVQSIYPDVDNDDVIAILKLINHYDPIAVGARDVKDCLLIQLKNLDALEISSDENTIALAKRVVNEYLQLLSIRDFRTLCKKLGIKEHQLKKVIDLITSLKPNPGVGAVKEKADFIIPDVIVVKLADGYQVRLNEDAIPSVRINETYRQMVNYAKTKEEKDFFKSHLQEANWFLQSLSKRNETLLKVASCIIEHQQEFLQKGQSAMQPMVLNDVAEQIGMHESTISRVTTQKYILTPQGTFELKFFFSSSVSTDDGNMASSTAIRALIKDYVQQENPRKPLSDSQISDMLMQKGIKVARRTIAKYRESLGIAPSSQRKRLT